jgi:hypothetical protein
VGGTGGRSESIEPAWAKAATPSRTGGTLCEFGGGCAARRVAVAARGKRGEARGVTGAVRGGGAGS